MTRRYATGGSLTDKSEKGTETLADAFVASSFRIGKYEVVGEIGRGGMGVVYRARDTELGREVAIKSPLPKIFENPRMRRRFMREARTASQLLHPNAVTIFEVFEYDETPYLVMELIEGRRLNAVIKAGGPLLPERVIHYGEGIAGALAAAHKLKILHRDVNPSNVLIADEGRARLTDFGIARLIDEPTAPGMTVTREGMVVGTRGYMSPEQALGKKLDHRTDIFNMGMLLYEMASGQSAFPSGETGEWLDALLHQDPIPLESINPHIPEELAIITAKAMQKDPADRYQSAKEMRNDLRSLRQSVESEVFTAPTFADRKRERRHRWLWAVAALILGAGLGWGWKILSQPEVLPGGMAWTPRQLTTDPGWESEPVISPDGTMVAYTSDKSGNADIWLMDANGGDALQLTDHPAADRSPTWTPDNSALFFVSERLGRPGIWRIPRLGGTPVEIIADGEDPAVSPDGTQISFSRQNATDERRILISSIDRPTQARWITGPNDGAWDHRDPAWSADGEQLAYCAWDGLHVLSFETAQSHPITNTAVAAINPTWGPGSNKIYFSSERDGTVALWRVSSNGSNAERLTMGTGLERHPSIDNAGRRITYATYSGGSDIAVLDRQSGLVRLLPGGRDDSLPCLAPDGDSLVFVSNREGSYKLWMQTLTNGSPSGVSRRITTDEDNLAMPSFSPDGRWIAGHRNGPDSDIWIIGVDGSRPTRFTDDAGKEFHPEWSPDGSTLAFISTADGFQHVWVAPISNGARVGRAEQVTFGDSAALSPTWSPNGDRIAFVRALQGKSEVWVARTNAPDESRQLTHGARAEWVEWDHATTRLLVSGRWADEIISLRYVSAVDGSSTEFDGDVDFGNAAEYGNFSASADGRFLAWSKVEASGNVWIADTPSGSL